MLKYDLKNNHKKSFLKKIILQTTKLLLKKFVLFFSSNIRMSGKNIIFDDKKINKSNFYKNKKVFNIYDMEVDKTLILKI